MAVFCKLQNRKVDDGECYDIQMVRNGYIKPEALPADISLKNADSICPFCKYNPLPEGDDLTDILFYAKNKLPYPSQIKRYGFVIHFHDGFVFEYDITQQYSRVNGKRFYEIELQDIENWVQLLAEGYYIIIQYKKRLFRKIPFRLKRAKSFKLKQPVSKSIEKIFTVSEVIYEKK